MRFRVLACDFDNTLAARGVAAESVVDALRRVSASGRSLILVTGRVLEELVDVFADVDLFDRVVAENGGLLYRPATGEQRLLGPPPPSELVAALRAAAVHPLIVGRVLCGTIDEYEAEVIDVLRRLRSDHVLIYNKDSIMVLPPGIDKAPRPRRSPSATPKTTSTCSGPRVSESPSRTRWTASRRAPAWSSTVPTAREFRCCATRSSRATSPAC